MGCDVAMGLPFEYRKQFLGGARASRLLQTLWRELRWQQHEITLFGIKGLIFLL